MLSAQNLRDVVASDLVVSSLSHDRLRKQLHEQEVALQDRREDVSSRSRVVPQTKLRNLVEEELTVL